MSRVDLLFTKIVMVSKCSRAFVEKMGKYQWKGCANCLVYDWKQVDPSNLKKCAGCKVLFSSL